MECLEGGFEVVYDRGVLLCTWTNAACRLASSPKSMRRRVEVTKTKPEARTSRRKVPHNKSPRARRRPKKRRRNRKKRRKRRKRQRRQMRKSRRMKMTKTRRRKTRMVRRKLLQVRRSPKPTPVQRRRVPKLVPRKQRSLLNPRRQSHRRSKQKRERRAREGQQGLLERGRRMTKMKMTVRKKTSLPRLRRRRASPDYATRIPIGVLFTRTSI